MATNWSQFKYSVNYSIYIVLCEAMEDVISEWQFRWICTLISTTLFAQNMLEVAEQNLRFLLERNLVTIGEFDDIPWQVDIETSINLALDFLRDPDGTNSRDIGFWLTITPKGRRHMRQVERLFDEL